jgi:2,3-bisphosphoglycerate-dependent phosphoglycerate mutase
VRAEVGDGVYDRWRRSYDGTPPPADGPAPDGTPRSESLADVRRRVVACWQEVIAPDLRAARTALVVAHSGSLRALCMHLDQLAPDEVARLDVPPGVPLRYDLDDELRPLARGGVWLDPVAAEAGIAEVRAQGRRRTDVPVFTDG